MGISLTRNNYTSLQKMVHDVHQDLVAGGFKLILQRDAIEMEDDSMVISPEIVEVAPDWTKAGLYVFEASPSVDPFAVYEPYNIVFMVHRKWWKVFVCTPVGLIYDTFNDTFSVESYTDEYWPFASIGEDQQRWVGALTVDGVSSDTGIGQQFLSFHSEFSTWPSLRQNAVDEHGVLELESSPLSYRITVEAHGIVFCTWAENMDDRGDCHSWFCIQRPKQSDGEILPYTGKHPLWCVYSQNGGGNPNDMSAFPSMDVNGIRQFVVRERDIDLPSHSCSAVLGEGEHSAIINPMEQTSLQEDGTYLLNIPSGLNSWRYVYPYLLDLIAFSSADLSAHGYNVTHDVFGNGEPITYYAMKANRPENRGMRMFMKGPDVNAADEQEPFEVPLYFYVRHLFRAATESNVMPLIFVEIELMEGVTSTSYPAPRDIEIPFTIDPSSTALEGIDYVLTSHNNHILIPAGSTKGRLYGQILPRSGDNGTRSVTFILTDNLGEGNLLSSPIFTIQDSIV